MAVKSKKRFTKPLKCFFFHRFTHYFINLAIMGNLKKKRRLKMNKHKRRKRLKSNRHKKRVI
ncbi:MAG: AURKAIP1/COX24 domain-containing protein [Opitutales bacterium]